jgi:hypothetical protein
LAGYYYQVFVDRRKPLCCLCLKGKHHDKFERNIATINKLLSGKIVNFEHFKDVDIVKKLMIDDITMKDKSCLPRNIFEKMPLKEVLGIYRKIKGV